VKFPTKLSFPPVLSKPQFSYHIEIIKTFFYSLDGIVEANSPAFSLSYVGTNYNGLTFNKIFYFMAHWHRDCFYEGQD